VLVEEFKYKTCNVETSVNVIIYKYFGYIIDKYNWKLVLLLVLLGEEKSELFLSYKGNKIMRYNTISKWDFNEK